MTAIDFSVVIPTRNRAAVLDMCLNALSKQNFPKEKFEIIVIDDGSTDATRNIVEKYGVNYIYQKPDGPASARNRGIERAKGEFICLLGHDQIVKQNWLLERFKAHQKYPNEALTGPSYPYPKAGPGYSSVQSELYNGFIDCEIKETLWLCCYNTSLKKAWLGLEKFDERFKGPEIEDKLPFGKQFDKEDKLTFSGEDTELGWRLKQRGLKIRFIKNAPTWHFHPITFEQYAENLEKRIKHDFVLEKLHPGLNLPCGGKKQNWFCYFNKILCGNILILRNKEYYNVPERILPGIVTIGTVFFGKRRCLEKYLAAIDSLDVDKKRVQLVFCDYSKDRKFGEIIAKWLEERRHQYKLVLYDKVFGGDEAYLGKIASTNVSKARFSEIQRGILLERINRLALGDFTLFIGDSTIVPKNCLKKLMKRLNRDVAVAGGFIFGKNLEGKFLPLAWKFLKGKKPFPERVLGVVSILPKDKGSEFVSAVSFGCCLVRNSAVDSLGFLPELADGSLFGVDAVFGFRAGKAGKKVVVDWSVKCKKGLKEKELSSTEIEKNTLQHNLFMLSKAFEKEAAEKEVLLDQFDRVKSSLGWKLLTLVHEIKKKTGLVK